MPKITIKNLENIRSRDPLLGEALDSLALQINNANSQTGADPTQVEANAPPNISQFTVTGGGGGFHAQILDNSPISRQIHYFVEYSPTPGFQTPYVTDIGPARNAYFSLGNKTLYWRAYSAYATSPASAKVYHGGQNPAPVTGGQFTTGSPLLPSAGAGTADINGTQGGTGFGPTQQR